MAAEKAAAEAKAAAEKHQQEQSEATKRIENKDKTTETNTKI